MTRLLVPAATGAVNRFTSCSVARVDSLHGRVLD
jgi:hypothetical protein